MNAVEKRFCEEHLRRCGGRQARWQFLKAGHRLYRQGVLEIPDLRNIIASADLPLGSFYACFPSGEAYIRSLLEWEIRYYFRLYRECDADDFASPQNIERWVNHIIAEFYEGRNLVRLFWHTLSMDTEFLAFFHQMKKEAIDRLGRKITPAYACRNKSRSADLSRMVELHGILTGLESALLHAAFDNSDNEPYLVEDVVKRLARYCRCSSLH